MKYLASIYGLLMMFMLISCSTSTSDQPEITTDENGYAILSDSQMEELVKRSYQYVAMYNVNNKFAMSQGGWNIMKADTVLKDHTMTDIARPNNDTFYATALLDLRNDPVIIDVPAFDSKYASFMVTAYDHYVNIPLATRKGNFKNPEKILIYSPNTEGYSGETVEGVDHIFQTTGDFVSAVFRIMPHMSDPERSKRIKQQLMSIQLQTLASFQGNTEKSLPPVEFPAVGKTDADTFENNLLEVMQFVFNHISFDANNREDKSVLAVYEPLGVVPGKVYNPAEVIPLDGKAIRNVAEHVAQEQLANSQDDEVQKRVQPFMFQPKGNTNFESLLNVSVLGPIGIPREEAVYPQIKTSDGSPMTAQNDYVIRMTAEELPPTNTFWSITLYDKQKGFFIPNDRKKYSVGENGGMKLNKKGGIEIYIAAELPEGVPSENWLPIQRADIELSPTLRIYIPDLEKMKTWEAPNAEEIK